MFDAFKHSQTTTMRFSFIYVSMYSVKKSMILLNAYRSIRRIGKVKFIPTARRASFDNYFHSIKILCAKKDNIR